MKHQLYSSLFITILLFLIGCGEDFSITQKEETPPPPPPPSADELFQQIVQRLQVINFVPKNIPLQMVLSDEAKAKLIEEVKNWIQQMKSQPNGNEATSKLSSFLDERLRLARDDQNAGLALLLCDLLEATGSTSTRIEVTREWASVYNNKPVVVIKGWFQQLDTPNEEIYAFCEVFLPETKEVHSVQVREGDEFFGLQFVKIIGKNRGMRIRYLATNDLFDVYGPGQS